MYIVAHNGSSIFGGGELGTVRLLEGLQRRGHRVLMLCRDRAIADRASSYGVPTSVQRIGGTVMVQDAFRMGARLRREQPDALLLTTFKKVVWAGLGARMAKTPRVVQRIVLQGDTPARGAQYRWAFRNVVDLVALNADAIRGPFLKADPALDPTKVITILDGVDLPTRAAPPGSLRASLGIPAGAPTVGAIARLADQKRFDRLLRALTALPSVHCIIAGEGDQLATLTALAAGLGIADRVHFLGFRRDIGDVLDAIDVFVVCSDREGMANAMLEAMAFGRPVVSTPVSGASEALLAGASETAPGLIVGFDDAELVAGLRHLVGNAELRGRMGEAGCRRWETRFSFATMVERWENELRPEGERERGERD